MHLILLSFFSSQMKALIYKLDTYKPPTHTHTCLSNLQCIWSRLDVFTCKDWKGAHACKLKLARKPARWGIIEMNEGSFPGRA